MRRNRKSHPGRILIIRLGALGDVLLTTPLVRSLRSRFPHAEIDFLCKTAAAPLVADNPYITRVLSFQTGRSGSLGKTIRRVRKKRYDVIVDLQGNIRSIVISLLSRCLRCIRSKHFRMRRWFLVKWHLDLYSEIIPVPCRHLKAAAPLGVRDDREGLDLFVEKEAAKAVQKMKERYSHHHPEGLIALAPGAGRATKRWPADRYGAAARCFEEKGWGIVMLGGEDDRETCQIAAGFLKDPLIPAGNASLSETAAWIAAVRLLITNDTGVMHMAAALRTPIVALFGPTTRHFGFMPFRSKARVVETDLPCRPCSCHGTDTCPRGHFNCMMTISVENVVREADMLLT
ncbi:MAG TPA: lipopolysaccharide heptosyltransferase II [bacterium]|nr:lipopolysaccharide heptosyltransferase II [bacterium]